jgi:hypothetical protein
MSDRKLTGVVATSKTARHWHQLPRIALINFSILIGLYLLAELALHIISPDSNPLLAKSGCGIPDPVYNHTLKPKCDEFEYWGTRRYRLLTNSLGFRDASNRDVPLSTDRKRIVFIGDSFTEGIGVPYQETFVGRFASAFPDFDVLNAGVVSYSPSVYFEKLKYLLDLGLRFDEVIVYVDISDIQDEAVNYSSDENGVLKWVNKTDSGAEKTDWWKKKFYIANFLNWVRLSRKWASTLDRRSLQDLMRSGLYRRDWTTASWTYDANASGYGSLGVEGGIQKAKKKMDRLYEVLSNHGISLSVGIYPWPQQLLYDDENSRQVKIWRDWCAGKCKRFYNHFPTFFQYKDRDPDFVRDLFIWADTHYNPYGHEVLANDLIEKYRHQITNPQF